MKITFDDNEDYKQITYVKRPDASDNERGREISKCKKSCGPNSFFPSCKTKKMASPYFSLDFRAEHVPDEFSKCK